MSKDRGFTYSRPQDDIDGRVINYLMRAYTNPSNEFAFDLPEVEAKYYATLGEPMHPWYNMPRYDPLLAFNRNRNKHNDEVIA